MTPSRFSPAYYLNKLKATEAVELNVDQTKQIPLAKSGGQKYTLFLFGRLRSCRLGQSPVTNTRHGAGGRWHVDRASSVLE